jgi:hypothetical protein
MQDDDIVCARERLRLYIRKPQLRIGSSRYSDGLHQTSKVLKLMPIASMLDDKIIGRRAMLTCRSESRGKLRAGQQSIESGNPLPGREIEKDVQLFSANPAYCLPWPRDIHNNSMIDTIQQLSCCQILLHADVNDLSLRKALSDVLERASEENRISKGRRTDQSDALHPLRPLTLTARRTDESCGDSKHRDTDPVVQ